MALHVHACRRRSASAARPHPTSPYIPPNLNKGLSPRLCPWNSLSVGPSPPASASPPPHRWRRPSGASPQPSQPPRCWARPQRFCRIPQTPLSVPLYCKHLGGSLCFRSAARRPNPRTPPPYRSLLCPLLAAARRPGSPSCSLPAGRAARLSPPLLFLANPRVFQQRTQPDQPHLVVPSGRACLFCV